MSHVSQDYVGRYRLLNQLRSGKTCQVWEVIDDVTGERLAIKLLFQRLPQRPRRKSASCRHEFEVGNKLHHPRVITIRDFGVNRDNVFLAMELFPAPNIKQVIQQNFDTIAPLAHRCIAQAAEGLAYFHEQGWIHRDVKPDNFLMKPTGEVKLIDFALAQRRRGGFMRLFSRTGSKIKGTRSYMAPEQIRGQSLDERADIYSLGLHDLRNAVGQAAVYGQHHRRAAQQAFEAAAAFDPGDQPQRQRRDGPVAQTDDGQKAGGSAGADCNEFLKEFRTIEVFKDS